MKNNRTKHNWLAFIIALLAGSVMVFAFAPYNLSIVAFLSFTVLGYLLINSTPKQGFLRGFGFGIGMFGAGVWWVYIALRFFGNAAPALAALTTFLLVLYLALFPGLVGYTVSRLMPKPSLAKLLVVLPAAWGLSEFLRGWFMTGFPWLLVGYTQLDSTLSSFAPIVGVYGLSFITFFCGGALAWSCYKPAGKPLTFYSVILVLLLGITLNFIHWTTPNHKSLSVSLVQGNITREFKWDPEKSIANINTYAQLTHQAWDSDFIVWPESSFTLPQTMGKPLLDQIDQTAKNKKSTLLVGLPYVDQQGNYYNSMMLLGQSEGKYFKRHLVPFGEYTPLQFILQPMLNWLKIPMSSLSEGPDHQPLLMVNDIPIAPYICYEIVYPNLVNQNVPQAQILLTISEDAWYGDSNAVAQHLQMAQMRSLESGRYAIFAVNNGISAIIDQHGQIKKSLGLHKRGVISSDIPAMIGATPWAILGDWPWLVLMALGLVATVTFSRKELPSIKIRRRSHSQVT